MNDRLARGSCFLGLIQALHDSAHAFDLDAVLFTLPVLDVAPILIIREGSPHQLHQSCRPCGFIAGQDSSHWWRTMSDCTTLHAGISARPSRLPKYRPISIEPYTTTATPMTPHRIRNA